MVRPVRAARHGQLLLAMIDDRDRHDAAVLRVQCHPLAEQCRVPQAGRNGRAGHPGRPAVRLDGNPVFAAVRGHPMNRPVVIGRRVHRQQSAIDPSLGLGLVEAIDGHESDPDRDIGDDPHHRFGALTLQLDRIGTDLHAVAHHRKAGGSGLLGLRHSRKESGRKNKDSCGSTKQSHQDLRSQRADLS
ncbi:MAG TPA: hypothetical protein VND95_09170 [Stellaceae bacterium]|nr:hypothetical protein [Stellaceae bacterium]